MGISTHLTQLSVPLGFTILTPFSFKEQKPFEPYLKKYTWLVYNNNKQLLDEVEHDIMNYQIRGFDNS